MAVTDDPPHLPTRPAWECRTCKQPWPCDTAREQLTREHDRVGLAMYAWGRLSEAAEDMPTTTPHELFTRFLAWTRTPFDR